MIPPHTETHAQDSQLTLYDSSQVPLTIHTITLTLTTNNSTLIDFRFTFQIPPELYQRIDTEALFIIDKESGKLIANRGFCRSSHQSSFCENAQDSKV